MQNYLKDAMPVNRRSLILGSLAAAVPLTAMSTQYSHTLRSLAQERGLLIGSCVSQKELANAETRSIYATQCNIICGYNQQQWNMAERRANGRTQVLELLDFATSNRQAVRWHSLLWGATVNRAARAAIEANDARALRAAIVAHIESTISDFGARVATWDVVNEPYSEYNAALRGLLGDGYLAELVALVEKQAPNSVKMINFEHAEEKTEATDRLIAFMRKWRASSPRLPNIAIGLQSHLWLGRADAGVRLARILDAAGQMSFPVWISELHVNATDARCNMSPCTVAELDEQAQEALRVFLSRVLDRPAVTAIMFWGMCDGTHFLNEEGMPPDMARSDNVQTGYALFDRNFAMKPIGGWLQKRIAVSPLRRTTL